MQTRQQYRTNRFHGEILPTAPVHAQLLLYYYSTYHKAVRLGEVTEDMSSDDTTHPFAHHDVLVTGRGKDTWPLPQS